jgi:hypothetical protein
MPICRTIFPLEIPDTDKGGEEIALKAAQQWMQRCEYLHDCGSWDLQMLPTRLISVGTGDEDVKLVITSGSRGKYACLSHCWGPNQPLRTETHTLQKHLDRIQREDLPPTFCDAISLTRKLGIDYIWIDSLCIIQDDHADWLQESARMGDVFRGSILTIAATAAKGAESGLHSTNGQSIDTSLVDGRTETIYIRPEVKHAGKWQSALQKSNFPLLTRSWVFQERLLSSRVLHFGPYELFWECHEQSSCACRDLDKSHSDTDKKHVLKTIGRASATTIQHLWRDLVEEYSVLELSKSSDKLRAILGLANEMARSRPAERYIAGLWSGSLAMDLLWTASLNVNYLDSHWPRKSYRTEDWRAPSWSWASLDADIVWPLSEYHCNRDHSEKTMALDFEPILVADGLDGLDRITGPEHVTLRLTGETFQAILHADFDDPADIGSLTDEDGKVLFQGYSSDLEFNTENTSYLQLDNTDPPQQAEDYTYSDDDVDDDDGSQSVVCMRMGTFHRNETDDSETAWQTIIEYTMIFVPLSEDGAKYRRVGMAIHKQDVRPEDVGHSVFKSPWQKPGIWRTLDVV